MTYKLDTLPTPVQPPLVTPATWYFAAITIGGLSVLALIAGSFITASPLLASHYPLIQRHIELIRYTGIGLLAIGVLSVGTSIATYKKYQPYKNLNRFLDTLVPRIPSFSKVVEKNLFSLENTQIPDFCNLDIIHQLELLSQILPPFSSKVTLPTTTSALSAVAPDSSPSSTAGISPTPASPKPFDFYADIDRLPWIIQSEAISAYRIDLISHSALTNKKVVDGIQEGTIHETFIKQIAKVKNGRLVQDQFTSFMGQTITQEDLQNYFGQGHGIIMMHAFAAFIQTHHPALAKQIIQHHGKLSEDSTPDNPSALIPWLNLYLDYTNNRVCIIDVINQKIHHVCRAMIKGMDIGFNMAISFDLKNNTSVFHYLGR